MKTRFYYSVIVAAAILLAGSVASASAQTEATPQKYVNIVKKDGKPAEKTLFRAVGNHLFNVKQFLYTYDDADRVTRIDINFWNEATESWELRYSAVYTYANGRFEQQLREFTVGTLQYEIIADAGRIRDILAL